MWAINELVRQKKFKYSLFIFQFLVIWVRNDQRLTFLQACFVSFKLPFLLTIFSESTEIQKILNLIFKISGKKFGSNASMYEDICKCQNRALEKWQQFAAGSNNCKICIDFRYRHFTLLTFGRVRLYSCCCQCIVENRFISGVSITTSHQPAIFCRHAIALVWWQLRSPFTLNC